MHVEHVVQAVGLVGGEVVPLQLHATVAAASTSLVWGGVARVVIEFGGERCHQQLHCAIRQLVQHDGYVLVMASGEARACRLLAPQAC